MGKIFITSDCHFNHKNVIAYEPGSRGFFKSIEEMNEAIIYNWNSVVSSEDTIYVCGDFFMGPLDRIEPILKRLNGHIILIRGNHDTPNRIKVFKNYGIEVKDIDYIQYKGRFFILCHFPIASPEFIQMVRQDNSEVVLLYGHIHSNAPKGYVDGTYHIGMDTNHLTPISLEQIWQECWPEEIMTPAIKEYKSNHSRCNKCVYETTCNHSKNEDGNCQDYKRDPPDGGYY